MPIQGTASWPGVLSVVSCSFTCSHGTAPGCAVLVCHPQNPNSIPRNGTLAISDGNGVVLLPGCRVLNLYGPRSEGEKTFTLEIQDRRWRWLDRGVIHGCYNQRDPRGKILLWTAKTVPELMELCFAAMGETNYSINIPQVITNTESIYPAVDWDALNPAFVLQQLAERVGCRVVYQVRQNRILVTPVGQGGPLPEGPIAREGGTIAGLDVPERIMVVGAPVRHQARFVLYPFGEEWDGSYRPIEHLSYKPAVSSTPVQHVVRVTPATVTAGNTFAMIVNGEGVTFTATGATVANVTAGLQAAFAASRSTAHAGIVATDETTHVTLTGPPSGAAFTVTTSAAVGSGSGTPTLIWSVITQGQDPRNPWSTCFPPHFVAAQETDRLSYRQAQALAAKSVFKTYRILNANPSDWAQGRWRKLRVPGYPKPIERVQQIIPQDSGPQQLTPQANDPNLLGPDGLPLDRPFYDGYTKDIPAKVWGSYFRAASGVVHATTDDANGNSAANTEVNVSFSIDPERMLVTFSEYVFKLDDGGNVKGATLYLETGCQIRDPLTNQIIRSVYASGGENSTAPPVVVRHDDVQLNYVGIYHNVSQELLRTVTDEALARAMSAYYLAAEALRHAPNVGGERIYRGIVPIDCDGAIQQVTWNVGGGAPASTHASLNFEHSTYIPTYPERLRLQYLAPAQRKTLPGLKPPDKLPGDDRGDSLWKGKPQ